MFIFVLAGLLIISSNDFLLAALSIELQALCMYGFLGLKEKTSVASETLIKYFYYSAFWSACMLYGISILWSLFGTLNFVYINHCLTCCIHDINISNSFVFLYYFAVILIISSLLFKLTLAPFYFWVGDVYEGSSSYIAAYMSIVGKIPTWVLLCKLIHVAFLPLYHHLFFLLTFLAVVSILVGTLMAFETLSFRRF